MEPLHKHEPSAISMCDEMIPSSACSSKIPLKRCRERAIVIDSGNGSGKITHSKHGDIHMNISSSDSKVHTTSRTRRHVMTNTTCAALLRMLLIMALFGWIGLQLYMTANYLQPRQSSWLPESLLFHHSSQFQGSDMNIGSGGHDENVDAIVTSYFQSFVVNFSHCVATLSGLLTSSSDASSVSAAHDESSTQHQTQQQQQMEEDYIFIFYILLAVNLLLMMPSLFQRYRNSKHQHNTATYPHEQITTQNSNTLKETSTTHDTNQHNTLLHQINHHHHQKQLLHSQKRQTHHTLFYRTYLPPYLLATCADWLQGPYKYALYSSYGYTQRDIAHLFVVGYGSGMLLGSIVGSLADKYGRKRLCLCYCVAYAVCVGCTHYKDYYVLLLGRCGGGVGTSLLFSVFESWLIGAHVDAGLVSNDGDSDTNGDEGEKWLAESFSVGTYGSSLVAIGSGVLSNYIVARSGKMRPLHEHDNNAEASNFYYGGYIAAFDACWPILMCCAALIMFTWKENYGQVHRSSSKADINRPTTHNSNADTNENGNGIQKITPRKLDYGYMKKHSSIIHINDHDLELDSNNETHLILQEIESQSNGNGNLSTTNNHVHRESKQQQQQQQQQQQEHTDGMFTTLWNGIITVWRSPPILMCCIIGSCFEGAMYIFIFLWTPALTSIQRTIQSRDKINTIHEDVLVHQSDESIDPHGDVDELPFGWIFSSFMICCMLGTIAFSHLSNTGVSASISLIWILALSAISCLAMAVPFTIHNHSSSGAYTVQYAGMLLYEFCIGAYFPAMGTVKGTIVPEDQRAAIYNVFRLPLNLMVLLYLVGDFGTASSFLANAVMLILACVLQKKIVRSFGHEHSK